MLEKIEYKQPRLVSFDGWDAKFAAGESILPGDPGGGGDWGDD